MKREKNAKLLKASDRWDGCEWQLSWKIALRICHGWGKNRSRSFASGAKWTSSHLPFTQRGYVTLYVIIERWSARGLGWQWWANETDYWCARVTSLLRFTPPEHASTTSVKSINTVHHTRTGRFQETERGADLGRDGIMEWEYDVRYNIIRYALERRRDQYRGRFYINCHE